MTQEQIQQIVEGQREYFASGATLDIKTRKKLLKALHASVHAHEKDIADALYKDLGKGADESYMCESGLVLSEITHLIKKIKKYAKPKRKRTPIAHYFSKSYELPSPRGNVLVMSPWNYPFLLSMDPLAEAVAAGNTVILKTSRYSPATADIIAKIVGEVFDERHVAAISGGREVNDILTDSVFDYIFFTGGKTVGKIVYEKAAKNMTPVTLELGGKSPLIVDKTANIKLAARRIVWGKLINAGQTCVAPDYLWCDRSIKDKLVQAIIKEIEKQYPDALNDDTYGKIITERHFERVTGLIDKEKVVYGGASNAETRKIQPTIMDNVTFADAVMGEEIFGPILPVMTFDSLDEVIKKVNEMPSPLALYFFSSNKKAINRVMRVARFGGGCVNDVVIHLATSNMGFGGFGASGIGSYHGKKGFDTFSHVKSIVDKKTFADLPFRYRPYTKIKSGLVKKFLK
ncbi:MAG: aldehyde dehydrogenase [Clostridiales bacterium]|nr:aldehyde dehydrogenase [Clostridiales bacterium]